MAMSSSPQEISSLLESHLQSWGLKRFESETDYYQWQRDSLSPQQLSTLHHLGQNRQNLNDPTADIGFYDLAAHPTVLPVLYSQRYGLYWQLGHILASRLSPKLRVLDFGCGIGILTTFLAKVFPDCAFIGVDRSSQSIDVASQYATDHHLSNIRFEKRAIPEDEISGIYDCIVSIQAVFQAEKDPGIPSRTWTTFERTNDEPLQLEAEARTGLQQRLDCLCKVIPQAGKIILCEKTRHLGRRVLLQRALARRGFHLVQEPLDLTYDSLGEPMADGPIYEVSRSVQGEPYSWNEESEHHPGQSLYLCHGSIVASMLQSLCGTESSSSSEIPPRPTTNCLLKFGQFDQVLAYGYVKTTSGFLGLVLGNTKDEMYLTSLLEPLKAMDEQEMNRAINQIWNVSDQTNVEEFNPGYENHTPIAQEIWESFSQRQVKEEQTFRQRDGQEMHIEIGTVEAFTYLYWANTYDQRQLVLVDASRTQWLTDYYQESLASAKDLT